MNKQDTILQLTKKLVSIASVVSTTGEQKIAEFVFDWLSQLEYFRENPNYLVKQPIKNDPLGRFNVLAMIKNNNKQDAMVGIAHVDTVDTNDYGSHQDLAYSVDKLTEALKTHNDTQDMLYGRGVLDMKSGVAIWMELLKTLSEEKTSNQKTLVVTFVVDEEGTSLGMRSVINMLLEWKITHNLHYLGAIDTDYTTSHYPDDPHRYVYFGTVGKLLVHVIAVGEETHASDPFLGIDANLMMAHIIDEINLNPEYTDAYQEKTTPPPIILHMENPKVDYSVKTNKIASTKFNVIMANSSIEQWMQRFKQGIKKSLEHTNQQIQKRLTTYNQNNEYPNKKKDIEFKVLFANELEGLEFNNRYSDEQALLEHVRNMDVDGGFVVVGLSAPYYPAHTCTLADQAFVDCVMNSLVHNPIKSLKVEPYYPYISDLSYLRSPFQTELTALEKHTFNTTWIDDSLWDIASKLDLGMVNIGPYGFDAHKKHERLAADSVSWVYDVIHFAIIND